MIIITVSCPLLVFPLWWCSGMWALQRANKNDGDNDDVRPWEGQLSVEHSVTCGLIGWRCQFRWWHLSTMIAALLIERMTLGAMSVFVLFTTWLLLVNKTFFSLSIYHLIRLILTRWIVVVIAATFYTDSLLLSLSSFLY